MALDEAEVDVVVVVMVAGVVLVEAVRCVGLVVVEVIVHLAVVATVKDPIKPSNQHCNSPRHNFRFKDDSKHFKSKKLRINFLFKSMSRI